jgi:two-component system alkaline phosphatase synthesis response regulator PhoP
MSKKKILIVEDDAAIKLGLHSALIDEGYEVHAASTGPNGFKIAEEHNPDLIILDVMLPGMSGYEICKKVRDNGIKSPIIMLTAKTEENDKVLGLELGADDYVTKPFSIRELMARVKANLRRHETADKNGNSGANGAGDELHRFVFGETVVDLRRHEVYKAGERQDVTNREFKLLEYFIQHPGEVLTRDRLLDEIWGYNVYPTTRTVDNHILRLRKHVEPNPDTPVFIKTVRGAGYLFDLG